MLYQIFQKRLIIKKNLLLMEKLYQPMRILEILWGGSKILEILPLVVLGFQMRENAKEED